LTTFQITKNVHFCGAKVNKHFTKIGFLDKNWISRCRKKTKNFL